MARWHWIRFCFVALAVLLGACSGDGSGEDPEGAAEPTVTVDPTETPTATVERVRILSGTVADLGDRRDLTFTVDDIGDITTTATVPDVVSLAVDEAITELADAGFAAYRVETFPPTDEEELVVDMWPSPGVDFVAGVNVFIEVDGPVDAVPVDLGDELSGIVNGTQFRAFDRFENWLVRVWLDDPIAIDVAGDTLTIGREAELAIPRDDIVCDAGEPVPDPTDFTPGAVISFTLAEDPADSIRFRPPERLMVADVSLDCG